jgi:hypothetical protein
LKQKRGNMAKKHVVYVLITKGTKQRFSQVRYGSAKKAREAAESMGREYMKETGNTCIIEKLMV